MKLYPVFLLLATATVFSPGPGVVMTLANAIRYGLRRMIGGIPGIAFGALIVAAISSTRVGVVLATSALAFTIMKYTGAAYLLYLGVKRWRDRTLSKIGGACLMFFGVALATTKR